MLFLIGWSKTHGPPVSASQVCHYTWQNIFFNVKTQFWDIIYNVHYYDLNACSPQNSCSNVIVNIIILGGVA
jgi:hypothetical protein